MSNILICSAGRRVSLVSYFKKEAMSIMGPNSKIYTTDLKPELSAASLLSDQSFKVGRFSDPTYIKTLLDICLKNEVILVIPTIDTELILLSQNRELFHAHGISIIVSDESFISICRNKRKMNQFFLEKGFNIPKIVDRNDPTFPLFIKPIDGSGSTNLYFIDHPDKLSKYLVQNEDLMWMEYIPKSDFDEYTVDLYYDKNSNLRCVVPRIRIEVRGGETSKGITKRNRFLIEFIQDKLNEIKGARGCLTLQVFVKKDNTVVYGIEINPRFGGGFPLSYLSGANYPKFIINEYVLVKTVDTFNDWESDVLLLRYDNELITRDSDY